MRNLRLNTRSILIRIIIINKVHEYCQFCVGWRGFSFEIHNPFLIRAGRNYANGKTYKVLGPVYTVHKIQPYRIDALELVYVEIEPLLNPIIRTKTFFVFLICFFQYFLLIFILFFS